MSLVTYFIHNWNYAPIGSVFLVSSIPIILWCCILYRIDTRRIRRLSRVLFVFSVVLIVYVTVLSRTVATAKQADLIPFSFIIRGMKRRRLFREVWMNVYLFIPLGLSGAIFSEKKQWRVVFGGFLSSILIETIQYCCALGMCETDDVLANTLGCTIGVLLYDWVTKIKAVRQKPPEQNPII